MGVLSLWDIVGPAARPVKLEALSRKKLAIDASIWIYQFLKAVRDKEGNSLSLSHIVGFFRRICKLLYFGIYPLFVFDGGAPPLKRQVVQKRRERRQGNSESIVTTAQKLLAIQVQRQAQESVKRPKAPRKVTATPEPAPSDLDYGDNVAYLEDLPLQHPAHGTTQVELVDSSPEKKFYRKDEFHLPDIKQFTVSKNDQRIMPESEFQEYGDDSSLDVVDGISIDSVDPNSSEFAELPMATQYMILSHLRLRSRLRLGYTKDQLENLFPNSKDFSKFQIQQVQKRNFYTQKLMNVSGMGDESGNVTRRIAGEKDKQYTLMKNDDGWTLSLGVDDEKPIELDENGDVVSPVANETDSRIKVEETDDDEDSDDVLEDVPLGQGDDEDFDKAVIESIYDQYREDYEPVQGSKDAANNDEDLVVKDVHEIDEMELKEAINQSKKDYLALKIQEEKLQKKFVDAIGSKGFDFGLSLLFAPEQKESETAVKNQGPESPKNTGKTTADEIEESMEEENDFQPQVVKSREVPLWFGASQIESPYAQTAFLADKPRRLDENEEAGIISWTEAREMINKNDRSDGEPASGHETDSDVELLESPLREKPTSPSNVVVVSQLDTPPGAASIEIASSKRLDGSVDGVDFEIRNADAKSQSGLAAAQNKVAETDVKDRVAIAETDPDSTVKDRVATSKANPDSKEEKKVMVMDYDFIDEDPGELAKQMREEEVEHAEFADRIRIQLLSVHTNVSDEQLLQEKLQKAKRDAEEVTQTMINDVQELLKRFGIPYITAPMEAEAQCAELYKLGLVDGIVTDDSDCFLFGGSRVYKNMFNQKQYVECYTAEDINNSCGLDQEKLINLALLLGSDYTEGIKGVGPVLAMEILAEFGTNEKFKAWFDNNTTNTASKPSSALEKSLLTRIKNGKLFLPDTFPDQVVVQAYTNPEVDRDDSEFKWGVPSLDQIRSFLMYNVRWTQEAVDEVMVPLIRSMNKRRTEGTQSTITEFFPQEYISYKKDVAMGKRMKVAANKLKK